MSLAVHVPSPEDERAIAPELAAGEKLLWSGHPRRGVRLVAADLLAIPFSLLWCGGVVFWQVGVTRTADPPPFLVLWGYAFVAAGLYLVLGRFFVDAVRRSKITYGLTSQRVIIISGVLSRSVKSLELAALGDVTLTERADKSGTITLGPAVGPQAAAAAFLGPSWPGLARYLPPMLESIEHARDVHERLRAAKNALRA